MTASLVLLGAVIMIALQQVQASARKLSKIRAYVQQPVTGCCTGVYARCAGSSYSYSLYMYNVHMHVRSQ